MMKNANFESSSLCNLLSPSSYCFFFKPNTLLRALFPNTPGLFFLMLLTQQASRAFAGTGTFNCTALHNSYLPQAAANLKYLAQPTALALKERETV
jgi:hypothetical protein